MAQYSARSGEAHAGRKTETGVLLVNLGTPEAPTAAALRPYLKQFLSDPRVIEVPRLLWMLILHCFILPFRPAKSARLYQSIWTDEGSPLLVISQQQATKLSEQLTQQGFDCEVRLAMRYGQPSMSSALRAFQQAGIKKLVVLPLYPQYSGPTTGSTFDALADELKSWRYVPELHFIQSYHDHPAYIDALAATIAEDFAANGEPDMLLLSYHGMPKRYLTAGDPYACYCRKTSRLVAEKLGLDKSKLITSFQSRFGREEWLKPYTDETLEAWPSQGIKDIAVACPAFSADCLETLEEMAVENKEAFVEAGGQSYRYVPALNDRADHISMMQQLVEPYLKKAEVDIEVADETPA